MSADTPRHKKAKPEQPIDVPLEILNTEQLGDLMSGTAARLSNSAWKAKSACERISYADDPMAAIAEAREHLIVAERHATAYAALVKQHDARREGQS